MSIQLPFEGAQNTQTDSLVMETARHYVVKALLPTLTVNDVLEAIELFNEQQIVDLVLQIPDKVSDRILAFAQAVELIMVDPSELETVDAH